MLHFMLRFRCSATCPNTLQPRQMTEVRPKQAQQGWNAFVSAGVQCYSIDTHSSQHCYTAREGWKIIDIESSTPSSISRRCKSRSNIYWLTEFCNSQCIPHFAAFFIINWAKTFIAKTHFAQWIHIHNEIVKSQSQDRRTAAWKRLPRQAMPPTSKWWRT